MDQQLLDRFFRGECTDAEQRKVLAWYLSGEADHELSQKIEASWREQDTLPQSEWGKEAVFGEIQAEIIAKSDHSRKESPLFTENKRPLIRTWTNAAAAVLLLAVASYALYFMLSGQEQEAAPLTTAPSPQQDAEIVKQTAYGEKMTITLADSTVIRLNSGSQLRYLVDASREVFLEGEAFFDVSRDTLHPFLIHTANITTTVLGTSFNIRAFAEDEKIAVSVVTGEVQVEQQKNIPDKIVRLVPGEQAMYNRKDTRMVKGKFDYENVLSWKEGRLHFKNARFSDIEQTLERWYGVDIEVRHPGIENGFSGSYNRRSLESVLEGMSFVLDFEFEIQDKKVIIL
jgi:ferric-dicitrate binding protein FerR (iron transport regulator)